MNNILHLLLYVFLASFAFSAFTGGIVFISDIIRWGVKSEKVKITSSVQSDIERKKDLDELEKKDDELEEEREEVVE